MSWSTNPAPPSPRTGPGWTTTPGPTQLLQQSHWFARTERNATLEGDGALSVAVSPEIGTVGRLTSTGQLQPDIAIRNYHTAQLTGSGRLVGEVWRSKAINALFTGVGEYGASSINDGLSAIIQVGYGINLSGGGTLDAVITGGQRAYPDGLSADIAVLYIMQLVGNGTLTIPQLKQIYELPVLPVASHYADDFNRANGPLGSNWVTQSTDANQLAISGNQLANTTPAAFQSATWATAMSANDHRVGFTVSSTGSYATWLYVRGGPTEQVLALVYDSGRIRIFTEIGLSIIEFGGDEQASVPIESGTPLVAGQQVTFEAIGNDYVVKVNGVARLTWTDSTGIYAPYVNTSHRSVSLGPYTNSGVGKIDDFFADDLPSLQLWASEGTLTADAVQYIGSIPVLAELIGNGTITAAAIERYLSSVSSGGDGTMTAAAFARYARTAALSGGGTLSATAVKLSPSITTVSPSTGAYLTAVTITGTGFVGVSSVTIGGQAVENLSVVSSTSITCTPPPLNNGTYDVVVTSPSGSNTKTNGFTYSFAESTRTSGSGGWPTGSKGVWIDCILGAGGAGGDGWRAAAGANRPGGGGGGGGGRITKIDTYIPRPAGSPTWTIVAGIAVDGANGQDSRFTTTGITLTAPGGLKGSNATSTVAGAGGTGGIPTASGATVSLYTGCAGGAGSTNLTATAGVTATTSTGGPGGGGGGGRSSGNVSGTGGNGGGAPNGITGGAGMPPQNHGTAGPYGDTALPYMGGGGGGAGGCSTNSTVGGWGGNYGAGGGGSGGYTTVDGNPSHSGGNGRVQVRFV